MFEQGDGPNHRVALISDLVDYAREGALRIPEFQRSFRWGQKDIFDLFDSIRRGYPVGNALLWRREAPAGNVRFGELGIVARRALAEIISKKS